MREVLQLLDSHLHETLQDASGKVVEANFYVDAQGKNIGPAVYLLATMTESAYDKWYFERVTEPELPVAEAEGLKALPAPEDIEEDVFPLVVPDSILQTIGLIEHIQGTYLDPQHPERLNEIARFLLCVSSDDPDA